MHESIAPRTLDRPGRSRMQALRTKIAGWIATCAAYYGAAATYEELSRLSDAELARRGLDRATLARELCEHSERKGEC